MQSTLVQRALQIVVGLFGLIFMLSAGRFIVDPATAVDGLGMELLDGVARSTQIGDIGGFFLAMTLLVFVGLIRKNAAWLRAAGLLVGCAAALRTLAWALHGAPFAMSFIAFEIVTAAVLWLAAARLAPNRSAGLTGEAAAR